LTRASTFSGKVPAAVDGRDEPGHDGSGKILCQINGFAAIAGPERHPQACRKAFPLWAVLST